MTDDNHLLDAVDRLTKPQRTKVIQDGPTGTGLEGQHTTTVELPPLLTQLETAITGTIGIGGSGSLKHERNMVDAEALRQFMTITSLIKDWARMAGAPITPTDIGATLRAWYIAYQTSAKVVTLDAERFYIRQMDKWADQIVAKLNPPRVWDLPDRCPTCHANTWWSKSSHEEYPRPLVVEYHEVGPNMIQEAKAMCRACEQVWGVRELAYAIENDGEAA